jgi:hypothetical protein
MVNQRGFMLKMKKSKELENTESRLTYLIDQLKDSLDDNDELNKTYNRLLIERACVRKNLKYHTKPRNVLTCFCQKLTRKKNEKLICDYFKS